MNLSLAVLFFLGQAAPPDGQSISGLAERYVDGTYRFSIQPPAGWQLVPKRERLKDEIVVLRMFQPLPDNGFQQIVLRQHEAASTAANQLLNNAAHNLELKYSAVEILSQQEQQIAERPAGYLAAAYRRDNARRLHLEAIVHLGKSQCMSILYEGPWEMRSRSEPLFQRVLASLRLLNDQMSEKELDAAFGTGKSWLSSLNEKLLRERIIADQMLLIEYQGKHIGFTRIQQSDSVLERHPGVHIRERGWIFEPDGRVQRIQNSMFVSYDLKNEKWRSSVTALPAPGQGNPDFLEVRLEEGVRTGDILLSNQTYDLREPSMANPAITLPEMYLSRALSRLLPALITDLSKQQRMAFLEFDHNKAGLIIRVAETKGESPEPEGRSRGKVFLIEQREGLAADPSQLHVDERGRIIRFKTGRLILRAAGVEAVEKEFAARVSAAAARMNELEKAYQEESKRFERHGR